MGHQFNELTLVWLYKFWALDTEKQRDHVKKVFTLGELWFSRVEDFNDPFDARPDYEWGGTTQQQERQMRGFYQRQRPDLKGAALEHEIYASLAAFNQVGAIEKTIPAARALLRQAVDSLGVCCFSEDWSNVLMWSHYASKHTGICIRFKAKAGVLAHGIAHRVDYQRDYPILNPVAQSSQEQVTKSLLTKADFWAYEREWRIIELETGHGSQHFPVNLIDSVILGVNITAANESLIRDWASHLRHKPSVIKTTCDRRSYRLRLA